MTFIVTMLAIVFASEYLHMTWFDDNSMQSIMLIALAALDTLIRWGK